MSQMVLFECGFENDPGDPHDEAWVYLLTDGLGEKIGMTKDLACRLPKLQTGNGRTLRFIAAWRVRAKCALRFEKTFTSWWRLQKYKLEGGNEWYDIRRFIACESAVIVAGGTEEDRVRLSWLENAMKMGALSMDAQHKHSGIAAAIEGRSLSSRDPEREYRSLAPELIHAKEKARGARSLQQPHWLCRCWGHWPLFNWKLCA